jgi:D-alanine-D-alanine ligase
VNILPKLIHYTTITDEDGYRLGFDQEDLGEFDWIEDLEIFDNTLRSLGVEPYRLGYGHELVRGLLQLNPPLLWNLNSGMLGPTREAQVPTLCEMLSIPLVGSGSWTAFVTQDKTLATEWVRRNNIPVEIPESITIINATEFIKLEHLTFPGSYIVKPNNEDSSRGIDENAFQFTKEGIKEQVNHLLAEWGPVRIEKYVDGFDISANLACHPDSTFLPLTPAIIETEIGIYTGAIKNIVQNAPKKKRYSLADYNSVLSDDIKNIALSLGSCFKFRHYARFDLRYELATQKIFFLDANICPSFEPNDDYAFTANLTGLSFPDLVSNILAAAFADATSQVHLREVPAKMRQIILKENFFTG